MNNEEAKAFYKNAESIIKAENPNISLQEKANKILANLSEELGEEKAGEVLNSVLIPTKSLEEPIFLTLKNVLNDETSRYQIHEDYSITSPISGDITIPSTTAIGILRQGIEQGIFEEKEKEKIGEILSFHEEKHPFEVAARNKFEMEELPDISKTFLVLDDSENQLKIFGIREDNSMVMIDRTTNEVKQVLTSEESLNVLDQAYEKGAIANIEEKYLFELIDFHKDHFFGNPEDRELTDEREFNIVHRFEDKNYTISMYGENGYWIEEGVSLEKQLEILKDAKEKNNLLFADLMLEKTASTFIGFKIETTKENLGRNLTSNELNEIIKEIRNQTSTEYNLEEIYKHSNDDFTLSINTTYEDVLKDHIKSDDFEKIIGYKLTEDDIEKILSSNSISVENINFNGHQINGKISFTLNDDNTIKNHFEPQKILSTNPFELKKDFTTSYEKEELERGNFVFINETLYQKREGKIQEVQEYELEAPRFIGDKYLAVSERIDFANGKTIKFPLDINGKSILTEISNQDNQYKFLFDNNEIKYTDNQKAVFEYKPKLYYSKNQKLNEVYALILAEQGKEATKENVLKLKHEISGDFNKKGMVLNVSNLKQYQKTKYANLYRLNNEVLFSSNQTREASIEQKSSKNKNYNISIDDLGVVNIEFPAIEEITKKINKENINEFDIIFSGQGHKTIKKNQTINKNKTVMEKNIEVTKENFNDIHSQLEKNPDLIKEIKNPTVGMSYVAVKLKPELIDSIDNPVHKNVINHPIFKENDFALQEAKEMFSTHSWSKIKRIKVEDPMNPDKEIYQVGKLIMNQHKDNEVKGSWVDKKEVFDPATDGITKMVKNPYLKDKLIKGNMVAFYNEKDGKNHFYKLDTELNRVLEVPRKSINISPTVGDYKLTTFDLNNLIEGKKVTDIPLGKEVVSITYDVEKNELKPASAQDQKKFQDYRANKETFKNKSMDVDTAKSLVIKLDSNNIDGFVKEVKDKNLHLSDDFLKTNVVKNKNIQFNDRLTALKKLGLDQTKIDNLVKTKDKTAAKVKENPELKEAKNKIKSNIREATNVAKGFSKSS